MKSNADVAARISPDPLGTVIAYGSFVIGMVFLVAFPIATAIIQGYVLSKLWGWFVTDFFHVPSLSIPMAIGIAMIIKVATYGPSSSKKDLPKKGTNSLDEEKEIARIGTLTMTVQKGYLGQILVVLLHLLGPPSVALFSGWIIHHWFI